MSSMWHFHVNGFVTKREQIMGAVAQEKYCKEEGFFPKYKKGPQAAVYEEVS